MQVSVGVWVSVLCGLRILCAPQNSSGSSREMREASATGSIADGHSDHDDSPVWKRMVNICHISTAIKQPTYKLRPFVLCPALQSSKDIKPHPRLRTKQRSTTHSSLIIHHSPLTMTATSACTINEQEKIVQSQTQWKYEAFNIICGWLICFFGLFIFGWWFGCSYPHKLNPSRCSMKIVPNSHY